MYVGKLKQQAGRELLLVEFGVWAPGVSVYSAQYFKRTLFKKEKKNLKQPEEKDRLPTSEQKNRRLLISNKESQKIIEYDQSAQRK